MAEAVENIFSFARAHDHAQEIGCGPDEALGRALAADFGTRRPCIDEGELIVGASGSLSLVTLNHRGLLCAEDVPDGLRGTEWEGEARRVIENWTPLTSSSRLALRKKKELSRQDGEALSEPSYGWGGGWGGHCILDYEDVLRSGLGGIRREVERGLEKALSRNAGDDCPDWYRAELAVCAGISDFIAGYAACAEEAALESDDDEVALRLRSIAGVCRRIETEGARTLHEAAQLFLFLHVLDETDSPGRIDQFLYPYYEALSDDPAERRRLAWPLLDGIWRKFIGFRTWNVCLAGQTSDGKDAVNELSYLFLDLQERHGREAPNLSVRFFRGSPPELLERCVEVIGKGSGQPALYHDEVIVPALKNLGIPEAHARNYAMNGCAQIDIQGMSHMGLEDGEVSLAKCLELALHQGISPVSGIQAGCRTLPLEDIKDFGTLQDQLYRQIEHATDLYTRVSNLSQKNQAESMPQLFRSLFVKGCVEKGKDLKRGGPLYNHGQFQTEGIANCGDSLFTIKRLVFDEKRLSLAELVAVLDADWEGHEGLRQEVKNRLPKFGNGAAEVDRLTAAALDCYFSYLNTKRTWRGGRYSGGVVVFKRAIRYGKGLAASADGRLAGEPVADSIGPGQGRDRSGPTAVLASVAGLPLGKATCAACLNMKLVPSLFEKKSDRIAVASLFRTFFELGGQQLQVNVVDRDTLIAAQQDPDRYRGLVVRVGGYSDLFVNLARDQQDDIIARTAHQL